MFSLLLGILGCVAPELAEGPPCAADPAACAAPAAADFAGIEACVWDGATGLVAAWNAAEGAAGYTFYAETVDGAIVDEVTTDDTEAMLTGLPDGTYVVRVAALAAEGAQDDGAEDDGGRRLRQRVGADRLVLRGELAFSGGGRTVEGEGSIVVVGGGRQDGDGVLIVDVSDPDAPEVLATLADLGEVTDVALEGGLLYVATDTALHPDATVSVRIYDLSTPDSPRLLGSIPAADDSAHTLAVGGTSLFLASTLNQWFAIYDVSDPTRPTRVGAWAPPPPAGVHDQTWAGGLLYVAYTQGMAILDVSDPTTPALRAIVEADWAAPFVHNLWPTDDGMTLAMSEEVVGGGVRVYDLTDGAAPSLAGSWRTEATHSVHDVVVRGEHAFAAWYVDGLVVLDLAGPVAPREVARYDTFAGPEAPEDRPDGSQWPNVSGATHVWPFGEQVAVSDQMRGLLLFDFYPEAVAWGGPWSTP